MIAVSQIRLSVAPYPGLRPFLITEADIFFGREQQTDQLLKKLRDSHFLAVLGPSGCGKSSLVRAGMMSALMAGILSDVGAGWRIAEMRPGNRPMKRLAQALVGDLALATELGKDPVTTAFVQATLQRGPLGLSEVLRDARLPPNVNLLLLVDQFEEIFRFGEAGITDEAEAFVALLLATAQSREFPVYIVLTMRSDFLNQSAVFTGLPEAMNESQFLTPRLTREQCGAAIAKPARVFGGTVDPALVNRLLNDMGADANQLPLLQHCLMRMWIRVMAERRRQSEAGETMRPLVITLDDYETVGTITRALSAHADEVLKALTDDQRKIAEVMFRRLTERNSSGQDIRHPASLGDIADVAQAKPQEVIDTVEEFRKPDRSFIMPPQGSPLKADTILDISHESLISLWRTLDGWVNKEAEAAASYARLKQNARLWANGKMDLLGVIDLDRTQQWQREQQPTIEWARRYGDDDDFHLAMKFLAASADRQKQLTDKKFRRRLRILISGYVLCALFAALAIFGWIQKGRAKENLVRAEEEVQRNNRLRYDVNINFAQRELSQERLGYIPVLLNEVLQSSELAPLRGFEWYYFWRLVHKEKGTIGHHEREIYAVAFSPDGRIIATGSRDKTAKLWDPNTHQELTTLTGHSDSIISLAFSPDGKTLVTGSWDRTAKVWDLSTYKVVATLQGHEGTVFSVAFSPDGRTIATGSQDQSVILWDAQTFNQLAKFPGSTGSVNSVSFSPDGTLLAAATWGGVVRIWRTNSRQLFKTLDTDGDLYFASFSPDGKTLAASTGKYIKVWETGKFTERLKKFQGHLDDIYGLAFSHDGKFLASASADRTARLWDLATGKEVVAYRGHAKAVTAVAFAPGDATVITVSDDTTAKIWDRVPQEYVPDIKPREVLDFSFSPDRSTAAVINTQKAVEIWNLQTSQLMATLAEGSGAAAFAGGLNFSPDDKLIAATAKDNTVTLWDSASRLLFATLSGHQKRVDDLAFAHDGKLLATVSAQDRSVSVWDLATKKEVATFNCPEPVWSVDFSPDGKMIAAGGDHAVYLIDLRSQKVEYTLTGNGDAIYAVVFSRDGSQLVTGSSGKNVTVWDVAARNELKTFAAHSAPVVSVAFSPDGRTLASASEDGIIKLWDPINLQELATLAKAPEFLDKIEFSPDGKILAAVGENNVTFYVIASDAQVLAQIR